MLFGRGPLVNTHHCSGVALTSSGHRTAGVRIAIGGPRTLARRCLEVAGWIVPSGMLALLPKCPACLAAYFAIGTGIGISMSTAMYLRVALVTLWCRCPILRQRAPLHGAVVGMALIECPDDWIIARR